MGWMVQRGWVLGGEQSVFKSEGVSANVLREDGFSSSRDLPRS